MTADTSIRRPSPATRRVGYGIAATINLVLLYLVNGRPGWDAIPFLNDATSDVIPLVNASLVASAVINLVQLLHDPRWLVALGGMVTTAIGSAALVRLWQVFPFDFGDTSVNWPLLARIALAVGLIGSLIGFVVQAVVLVGSLPRPHHPNEVQR
jgi:hypothetical protein